MRSPSLSRFRSQTLIETMTMDHDCDGRQVVRTTYVLVGWQLSPSRCLISRGTSRKRAIILFPPTLMSKHMLPVHIRAEYKLMNSSNSSPI